MPEVVEGVIDGETIELTALPRIADRQRVEVTIRAAADREA